MLPDRVRSLTYLLSRLPGVGEKTAQRFAMHFVSENTELANELGTALSALKEHIGVCRRCGCSLSEGYVFRRGEPCLFLGVVS